MALDLGVRLDLTLTGDLELPTTNVGVDLDFVSLGLDVALAVIGSVDGPKMEVKESRGKR